MRVRIKFMKDNDSASMNVYGNTSSFVEWQVHDSLGHIIAENDSPMEGFTSIPSNASRLISYNEDVIWRASIVGE